MSLARHCDGPDCNTWQRIDSTLSDDWFYVSRNGRTLYFCLPDCVLRYFAQQFEPTTVLGEHE